MNDHYRHLQVSDSIDPFLSKVTPFPTGATLEQPIDTDVNGDVNLFIGGVDSGYVVSTAATPNSPTYVALTPGLSAPPTCRVLFQAALPSGETLITITGVLTHSIFPDLLYSITLNVTKA